MASSWYLTVRHGPRVERQEHPSLSEALDALEARGRTLAAAVRRPPVDLKVRRIEPMAQVAARLQIGGPGRWRPARAGGVDVRGDGSVEAFSGRLRRRVLDLAPGEDAFAGLRRALAAGDAAGAAEGAGPDQRTSALP